MLTKRPTGLTITAWLWIATGGFMILSGVMGLFVRLAMRTMGPTPDMRSDLPAGFALMSAVFRYFEYFVVVQCVIGSVAVYSGVALLRLRAWARTAIEGLSWLGCIYTVGFGIFWVCSWVSMTGQTPNGTIPINPRAFQMIGAAMGTIVMAAWTAPLLVMIRYLRGAEARQAFAARDVKPV